MSYSLELSIYEAYGDIAMKTAGMLLVCACILGGCSYLNQKAGMPDDNFVEESVEYGIFMKTGLDIDLTPMTKER